MAVTIEDIKKLREKTGVSISACKKALEETNGDFEQAIEVLRKKGEAKAASKGDRETGEGAVAVKVEGGKGAMVSLLCETDFVAKSPEYQEVVDKLVEKLFAGEITVDQEEIPEVKEAVLKLGENIKVGEMAIVEGDSVGSYVHSNKKIGVLVALEGGDEEVAKDIAMHSAATNPQVLSPDEVDQELVDKEKEIWAEQLKNEGKPENIIDKIMMGKENKFRGENALVTQPFVKNPEQTVGDLLKSEDAKVKGMVRFGI